MKIVEKNMKYIKELLQSKQQADVKECIMLVQRCYYYELEGASDCLHNYLLPLIFNKEMPDIQKEVLKTFKMLYLGEGDTSRSVQDLFVKLMELVQNASIGEQINVKEIFGFLLKDDEDFETNQLLVKPLIKVGWKLLNDFHAHSQRNSAGSDDVITVGSCLKFFEMIAAYQPEMVIIHYQYLYNIQLLAFHAG